MTDTQALIERLEALDREATPGPWRKFNSEYGNSTIAIMKGPRPPSGERWDEIIAWPGFDASDVSKKARHANARLIVFVRNLLPEIIAALREREGLAELLAKYRRFAGETAGACLGLAMSTDHPAPDEALMEIFHKSQALAADARALTTPPTGSAAAPDGGER